MKYTLTRDAVVTLTAEIEADSPTDAVILAMAKDVQWKDDDGEVGLCLIDAVSEGSDGKCWSVEWTPTEESIIGEFELCEVEDEAF